MWCRDCRQEVPGIASHENNGRVVCARCGAEFDRSGTAHPHHRSDRGENADAGGASDRTADTGTTDAVIDLDNWELEDDLKEAERLTMGHCTAQPVMPPQNVSAAGTHESFLSEANWRVHGRHDVPGAPRFSRERSQRRKPRRTWASWSCLSVGVMTFVCGAVLSGWSFAAGRGELWNVGVPLVLAGQAVLLLGLVFQLDGLWQTNRETTDTLDELDSRLSDLKHSTTLLSTTHSPAAQSFYAHMAEGASPQLLLADLKGQLDMLAMKLSQSQ